MLGSENELYRENENKSNLAFPSMISQLTTLAAQTLEGSLLLYWKTSAHGTNGNLQKALKASIARNLIPKSKNFWLENLLCQRPARRRGSWQMGAPSILEMASSLQPGLTKLFPVKRNERCPKAASSPANEKWESNSVASSNSSHFDFSSNTGWRNPQQAHLLLSPPKLNLIDHLLSQMRCSVTSGSGSPLPTTSSPSRGLLSPTTPPDFPPILFN